MKTALIIPAYKPDDKLNTLINDYLDSVTLEDLVSTSCGGGTEACQN